MAFGHVSPVLRSADGRQKSGTARQQRCHFGTRHPSRGARSFSVRTFSTLIGYLLRCWIALLFSLVPRASLSILHFTENSMFRGLIDRSFASENNRRHLGEERTEFRQLQLSLEGAIKRIMSTTTSCSHSTYYKSEEGQPKHGAHSLHLPRVARVH